jgi:hypothetical protein
MQMPISLNPLVFSSEPSKEFLKLNNSKSEKGLFDTELQKHLQLVKRNE